MDYSLQAYIERLPIERLEKFLEQYYGGEFTEDFTNIVPYIEYVVERRKAQIQ